MTPARNLHDALDAPEHIENALAGGGRHVCQLLLQHGKETALELVFHGTLGELNGIPG